MYRLATMHSVADRWHDANSRSWSAKNGKWLSEWVINNTTHAANRT